MPIEQWNNDPRIKEVLGLGRGYGITSRWPAVINTVRAYGQLNSGDLSKRRQALREVEGAAGEWVANYHKSTIVLAKMEAQKKYQVIRNLLERAAEEQSQLQPSRASIVPAPTSTAAVPINIGGSQPSAASHATSISPPHVPNARDNYGVWPQNINQMNNTTIADDDVDLLSRTMDIHVHFTRNRNAASITREGLHPGRGQGGVGLPTDRGGPGGPDRVNYYTLSGSSESTTRHVMSDAGPRNVVVFSQKGSLDQYSDPNYASGARSVPGNAVPLGDNTTLDNPVSLVLPLDQRSAQQLSDFMARVTNNNIAAQPVHAAALLQRYLQTNISPIRFMGR